MYLSEINRFDEDKLSENFEQFIYVGKFATEEKIEKRS